MKMCLDCKKPTHRHGVALRCHSCAKKKDRHCKDCNKRVWCGSGYCGRCVKCHRIYQRDLLRKKRADAGYRRRERKKNTNRMREVRAKRAELLDQMLVWWLAKHKEAANAERA